LHQLVQLLPVLLPPVPLLLPVLEPLLLPVLEPLLLPCFDKCRLTCLLHELYKKIHQAFLSVDQHLID
jgi:hypothetical protein